MIKPGKIKTFEDLIAWEKGMSLSVAVYRATNSGSFSNDFSLRGQIRKASISITSNIAEGFGRYGIKEFRYFLSIANGSAYEVRSQLRLASRLGYLTDNEAEKLIENCKEVSRLIEGLRRSSKRSDV